MGRCVLNVLAVALVAVAVLGASASARGVNSNSTSARVTVAQPGLDQLEELLVFVVETVLHNGTSGLWLPDQHLDMHVAEPIGHITLDLTQIRLTGFTLGSSSLKLSSPADITLALGSVDFTVSLDYKWRKVHWPHASDHGTVTASPSGQAGLALPVSLDIDNSGRIVASGTPTASFPDWSIKFHGKVSWLYNLLVSLFKSKIGAAVDKAVVGALGKGIVSLDAALQRMNTEGHFGGGKSRADLFLGFTGLGVEPEGPSGSLLLNLDDAARVSNNLTEQLCPFAPVALPYAPTTTTEADLSILVADAFPTCMGWVSYANGALNATFNPNSKFPIPLNTTAWKKFIPALYKDYPNAGMVIDMQPAASPNFTTTAAAGMVLNIPYLARSFVVNASDPSHLIYTHTIGAAASASLDVAVGHNATTGKSYLGANVTALSISLKVVDSAIGPISVASLDLLVKLLLAPVQGIINGVLSAVKIPLPGFFIVAPTFTYSEGYLAFSATLKFKQFIAGLMPLLADA